MPDPILTSLNPYLLLFTLVTLTPFGIDQWDNINRFNLQVTELESSLRPNCIHVVFKHYCCYCDLQVYHQVIDQAWGLHVPMVERVGTHHPCPCKHQAFNARCYMT